VSREASWRDTTAALARLCPSTLPWMPRVLRQRRLIADHVEMALQVRDAFGAMAREAPSRRDAAEPGPRDRGGPRIAMPASTAQEVSAS
jgi:hypothetical protein